MTDSYGFGVIGTGVWGETHLMTYASHPGARLACICDLNEELVTERAAAYGAESFTTDYTDLLARDDIAAVSIVTPDFLHRELVLAAAEAGKHILIEKPMATTVEDCQAMIDATEAAGVKLMVDFHNRWNPAMWNMRQAVEAGEIGEPQMLSLRLNDTIYVPTEMLSWGGQSTVIWFLGSHSVDLVRWLFDDEVTRVFSVARSRVLKERGLDTPDFFHTILELAGGGVAHVENCWIMSEQYPSVADFKVELIGAEGTMLSDITAHRVSQQYSPDSAGSMDVIARTTVQGRPGGFAINSIRHFADCVINDTEPLVTGEDGLRNTKVLVAIHESARTGQPVDIDS